MGEQWTNEGYVGTITSWPVIFEINELYDLHDQHNSNDISSFIIDHLVKQRPHMGRIKAVFSSGILDSVVEQRIIAERAKYAVFWWLTGRRNIGTWLGCEGVTCKADMHDSMKTYVYYFI